MTNSELICDRIACIIAGPGTVVRTSTLDGVNGNELIETIETVSGVENDPITDAKIDPVYPRSP